jgi:hypothetical protein
MRNEGTGWPDRLLFDPMYGPVVRRKAFIDLSAFAVLSMLLVLRSIVDNSC